MWGFGWVYSHGGGGGVKLDDALCKLTGKQMIVQHQHFKVRICVEGDHMLQHKICGRDGPTSRNEDRYPCVCCSETAPNVLSYGRPLSQLAKSPNSLLPSVSVEQCNYEAKRHSPTCFGMQPNHGGCLLCCYTGYLGIFSSFLV